MNRLLELLIAALGENFNWTSLLGTLAERLLADIYTTGGCKEFVIDHLKNGTLDDEFAKNPVHVLICLGHIALALADQYDGHDHDSPVITCDPWVGEFAMASGETVPAEGNALLLFALKIAVDLIVKYLNK